MTATALSGPERRRRWTRAEKLRLIEETLAREATVAEVARRYDVHPNLLHSWRRQAQQGVLTGGAGASPAPADATGRVGSKGWCDPQDDRQHETLAYAAKPLRPRT